MRQINALVTASAVTLSLALAAAGGDCNGNGIPDACEVAGGSCPPLSIAGPSVAHNEFGQTLDIDGDRLVATATIFIGDIVCFYERANGVWTLEATFPVADVPGGPYVAIDGSTAVVSQREQDRVLVFERDAGGWAQTAVLEPDAIPDNAVFGEGLALENDVVVVGSAAWPTGSVFIFRRAAAGDWRQEAVFTGDPRVPDELGWSVAIAGGVVAAGDMAAPPSGVVRLFARESPHAWTEIAQLRPSHGVGLTGFGNSLAMAPGRLVVAYPGEASRPDTIDVFRDFGCGSWARDTTIPIHLGNSGFGPLAVDGDLIAASRGEDGPISLLRRDSYDGSWSIDRDLALETTFSLWVSGLSFDGGRLALGATDAGPHGLVQVHHFAVDCDGNGVPDVCQPDAFATCAPPTCTGDATGDRLVDALDLAAVLAAWNCDDSPADVNADGIVDVADIASVIATWGSCD